jgi:hypothetical protein
MLLRLSPSRSLWLSRSCPLPLPFLCSYRSWHDRQTGWLSIRSARLPFLWLLLVRHLPTRAKLDRMGHGIGTNFLP